MSDQLSELDALIESDILEALGEEVPQESTPDDIDSITIEDLEEPTEDIDISNEMLDETPQEIENIQPEEENTVQKPTQTMASSELATLLSELLNNKTIEITIKIKD